MRFRWVFSVLAVLTILFTVNAGAQGTFAPPQPPPAGASTAPLFTPEQIAKMPVVALPVRDFKLLTSGTGWVSTGNRLLLTTDNGAHWREISPPNPNQYSYDDVVFINADTAWVLNYVANTEDDIDFVVSSTVDGGTTWAATKIKIPLGDPAQGAPELAGGGAIAFADKLHGWLIFRYQTGSAFNSAGLFATSDGGRTWQASNDNPGFAGEIRAYPNGDVWVSGHPGVNEGGKIEELVVSHKGGNGFEDVSLPAPKDIGPVGQPSSYTLPVFEDNLRGYEAASYYGPNGTNSTEVLFETLDGGRTWKADRILSNLTGSGTAATTIAGSTWILPFAPKGQHPALVKLRPNDRKAAPPHSSSGDFSNCELSFVTADEGWMNCSGILSSTIDGGATWANIAPRVRNGALTTARVTPVRNVPIQVKDRALSAAPAPPPIGLPSGTDQRLRIPRNGRP